MTTPIIPESADESETERDGFLSTRREIHAAIMGLAVGVAAALSGSYELAGLFVFATLGAKLGGLKSTALAELRREPWYGLAAFLLGLVLTLVAMAHY